MCIYIYIYIYMHTYIYIYIYNCDNDKNDNDDNNDNNIMLYQRLALRRWITWPLAETTRPRGAWLSSASAAY